MKAYSVDLRQKIIETYLSENVSQRKLAQRFQVTLGFITKLLKQYNETGSLEPKTSPGRPLKLNEEQLEILKAVVEEKNDLTLEEYQSELEKRTRVQVSRSTIDRMIKRLGITVKKNRCTQRRRKVRECKS